MEKSLLENNVAVLSEAIDRLENKSSRILFILPEYDRPSGGMAMTYSTIKHLNDNGYNAKIVFKTSSFDPKWKPSRYPTSVEKLGLSDGFDIRVDDIIILPEGLMDVAKNLIESKVPCKIIIFCQNWYYVLNSLAAGMTWDKFGIRDCISISGMQTKYINSIMPNVRVKNVNGRVDPTDLTPPKNMIKKIPTVAFIPSRWDNGLKSYNVIKTFYCLYDHLKWVTFKEIKGMSNDDFCDTLNKCAFYCHFDEYSSWGTAPIEAWINKCYVAGWDGFGGREYMKPVGSPDGNTWLAPNGDIIALAIQLGRMIESWIVSDIPDDYWKSAQTAVDMFSPQKEEESILNVYGEYFSERMTELKSIKAAFEKELLNEDA